MDSISFVSEDENDELNQEDKDKKQHDLHIEEQLTQATTKLVSVQNEIEIRVKEKEEMEKIFEGMDRGYLFDDLQFRPPIREVKGETELIMEKINSNLRKFFKETEEMVDEYHEFIGKLANMQEIDFSKGNFNTLGVRYAEKKNNKIGVLSEAEKIQAKYAKSNDDEKNVLDERYYNVYYESFRIFKGMKFLDLKKAAVDFWVHFSDLIRILKDYSKTQESQRMHIGIFMTLLMKTSHLSMITKILKGFSKGRETSESNMVEVRKLKRNTENELASELYKQMPALKNYIDIQPEPEDRREAKEKKMKIDDKNCLVLVATIVYLILTVTILTTGTPVTYQYYQNSRILSNLGIVFPYVGFHCFFIPDYNEFRGIVNGLRNNPFIDRQTKAIFLNIVWVDPNIDMWNFLELIFEFSDNYQIINSEFLLRNFRPNAFDWSGAAIFALYNILKIVFSGLIFTFLFFNIFVNKTKDGNNWGYLISYEGVGNLGIATFSVLSFAYGLIHVGVSKSERLMFEQSQDFHDLDQASFFYSFFVIFDACMMAFLIAKTMAYLRFYDKFHVFLRAIEKANAWLFSYFVIFFGFLSGFSIVAMHFYGNNIESMNSYNNALVNTFLLGIGHIQFLEMVEVSSMLTTIYFFFYFVIIYFFLTSFFLGIYMMSYQKTMFDEGYQYHGKGQEIKIRKILEWTLSWVPEKYLIKIGVLKSAKQIRKEFEAHKKLEEEERKQRLLEEENTKKEEMEIELEGKV